ncbi:NADP-dependent glyceraldehyde-3-phosphate dehydrogenase [Spiroplasma eriocheiris]|uniref:Glyceraldehyde-3-phosphate dehydrogenase n=1 Tax=Spiroplasma eriocheiris TaxID=315358 RepID=A0A0H3XHY2_9MOLU|nr:NADP-dependent glyceraldehyde-3-phosphate dehydrogenase [Spiroplasma eriocheiris]AHF57573.1 NADP-dependent glyceraldehyde-3-phosphate dehydrogenase [Spiroplasma eriocheiris CCTCC M 207170]AKM54030.1 glyceraldehyde-3-phosphate dehydrogenase [Spiroplasma eriocheiris]
MNWTLDALIDGKLINNGEWLEIISPIDLKPCGKVPALKAKEIDLAFKSARQHKREWANLTLFERIKYLEDWSALLLKHKAELAKIMAYEVGKNLKDGETEVLRSVEYIEYTIEEAKRIQPEALTGDGWNIKNKMGIFTRVPRGVILAISPYNYPVNLSISKIAPSLVVGNTVVFKPATNGSLVGLYMAKLAMEANFPRGVFNVVTGRGRDIGDLLVSHHEINLISFTGSVEVGNHIKNMAKGRELVLELGGKDPALVLADADLHKTVKEIIGGAFSYSGQRCTAIKRVLVDETVADELVKLLKPEVEKLTMGSPLDNHTIIPLIDLNSADFVQGLIDDALAQNAKLIVGNKRECNLMAATLIDHVTTDMRLAWEEPFGPVLPIIRCKTEEEMVKIANKSNFGLQASIFTRNINKAFHLAHELETGTVNINGKSQRGPDSFPFLGIKESGQGVQGIKETLNSVTRIKGLVINY